MVDSDDKMRAIQCMNISLNYLPLPARTPETHKETTAAKEANISMVDLKQR